MADGAIDDGRESERHCAMCGTSTRDPSELLTWVMGSESGRTIWTCAQCSRRHVRSIEAKLDSTWW
ncbi:hypothetical protein [Janibacter sp. GXQ6167]|uniref:hypothetical protein n=1 Tax=Janibacter sp. GXQ6167 TaxID=3240791 RepID=UPI00352697E2